MISIKPIAFSKQGSRTLYGRYKVGPFSKGTGLNILNMLSTSLKSDLSRVSITCIEFKKPTINHEYTFIDGMRENPINLLRNLQGIIFVVDYQQLAEGSGQTEKVAKNIPIKGHFRLKGPREITAKDLKLPKGLFCVDPNQYIGTIDSNNVIEFDFFVNGPTSFALSMIHLKKNSTKLLFTTPTFNPIEQVNMCLEDYIVDYVEMEFGLFEIWTDGSIHPYSAIKSSLSILTGMFWTLFKATSKYETGKGLGLVGTEPLFEGTKPKGAKPPQQQQPPITNIPLNISNPETSKVWPLLIEKTRDQTEENQFLSGKTLVKTSKREKVKKQQTLNHSFLEERKKIKEERLLDNMLLSQLKDNKLGDMPIRALRNIVSDRQKVNRHLREQIKFQVAKQDKLTTKALNNSLNELLETARQKPSEENYPPLYKPPLASKSLNLLNSSLQNLPISYLNIPNASKRFLQDEGITNTYQVVTLFNNSKISLAQANILIDQLGESQLVVILKIAKNYLYLLDSTTMQKGPKVFENFMSEETCSKIMIKSLNLPFNIKYLFLKQRIYTLKDLLILTLPHLLYILKFNPDLFKRTYLMATNLMAVINDKAPQFTNISPLITYNGPKKKTIKEELVVVGAKPLSAEPWLGRSERGFACGEPFRKALCAKRGKAKGVLPQA